MPAEPADPRAWSPPRRAGAQAGRPTVSERMRRVDRSVRAVVAEAIGELKDPRIGIVTSPASSVSPDLHDARVYVSVFGSRKRQRAALAALDSARRRPAAAARARAAA